jgi:hypothetical protein
MRATEREAKKEAIEIERNKASDKYLRAFVGWYYREVCGARAMNERPGTLV